MFTAVAPRQRLLLERAPRAVSDEGLDGELELFLSSVVVWRALGPPFPLTL